MRVTIKIVRDENDKYLVERKSSGWFFFTNLYLTGATRSVSAPLKWLWGVLENAHRYDSEDEAETAYNAAKKYWKLLEGSEDLTFVKVLE